METKLDLTNTKSRKLYTKGEFIVVVIKGLFFAKRKDLTKVDVTMNATVTLIQEVIPNVSQNEDGVVKILPPKFEYTSVRVTQFSQKTGDLVIEDWRPWRRPAPKGAKAPKVA